MLESDKTEGHRVPQGGVRQSYGLGMRLADRSWLMHVSAAYNLESGCAVALFGHNQRSARRSYSEEEDDET